MHTNARPDPDRVRRQLQPDVIVLVLLLLLLTTADAPRAENDPGSNTQPFAFGADQTIIDLNKLVWATNGRRGPRRPRNCRSAWRW